MSTKKLRRQYSKSKHKKKITRNRHKQQSCGKKKHTRKLKGGVLAKHIAGTGVVAVKALQAETDDEIPQWLLDAQKKLEITRDMTKRPKTGYLMFQDAMRTKVRAELEKDVIKSIAELWSKQSRDEKQYWKDQASAGEQVTEQSAKLLYTKNIGEECEINDDCVRWSYCGTGRGGSYDNKCYQICKHNSDPRKNKYWCEEPWETTASN